MNWERAKTWFIIAFLVLDLLLAWQLYTNRQETAGYVESYADQLANTKTLLAEHGFTLAARVPTEHPSLSSLHGTYANPSLRDLAETAFPKARHVDDFGTGAATAAGRIAVLGNGSWQVTYNKPVLTGKEHADAWLQRVWHADLYAPDPLLSDVPVTTYDEQFSGYPMFDVPLAVDARGNAMNGYIQTCVVNVAPVGRPNPTISALDALDSLATMVDNSSERPGARIEDIQLGYMRKVSVNPADVTTSSNYWFPVWRVVTNRQIYYINAFTGEVDSPY